MGQEEGTAKVPKNGAEHFLTPVSQVSLTHNNETERINTAPCLG